MTPEEWLHATALVAGTTEDISSEDLDLMISEAQQRLRGIQPIDVTISRVAYHPEAIMLGFTPEGALDPIHSAVRQATLAVTGRRGSVTGPAARWTPNAAQLKLILICPGVSLRGVSAGCRHDRGLWRRLAVWLRAA
jgi:hypothetical protein